MPISKPITKIRKNFKELNINGYIIPSNDEFMSEYVPEHAKRLEWATGFTGSAGVAVILEKKAAFFTDGRYMLQAKKQVNNRDFKLYDIADTTPIEWIEETLAEAGDNQVIGFDPLLHSVKQIKHYQKAAIYIKAIEENLIDQLWLDKPKPLKNPISLHSLEYAGMDYEQKREPLMQALDEYVCDYFIITAPDSLSWLLNIRGQDVPCTPVVNAYAVFSSTGETLLFIDGKKITPEIRKELSDDIIIIDTQGEDVACLDIFLTNCANDDDDEAFRFMVDHASPYWFYNRLLESGLNFVTVTDPIQLMKASKNDAEMDGAFEAHSKDGLALIKFLHWFEQQIEQGESLTEISAAAKLAEFRAEDPAYLEPSFPTISGYGANGAIIHYHPTEETNNVINKGSLYLVDSGGQYPMGTTDVTRTIAVGNPSREMIQHFTLVLKGHLSVAMTSFPAGTTGSQLDSLARQYLWQQGLDYAHGTGHGVGSYLSVHEGPQRISKAANHIALKHGMIISNEPGLYLEGKYGIRIENLLMVMEKPPVNKHQPAFLGFVPLTLAPIDRRLVDIDMLTDSELSGLNAYHGLVLDEMKELLADQPALLQWLEKQCQPLVRGTNRKPHSRPRRRPNSDKTDKKTA